MGNWEHPARGAFEITPSDTVNLPRITRGIYVGGAGNIHVLMENGSDATFNSVSAGAVYPLCVVKVYSTGTTATNMVGMY